MTAAVVVRPITVAELADYKALRDEMLSAHPEAFTSDAEAELHKEAADYLQRLGVGRRDGGHFLLGAWRGGRLLGAIGCERDTRKKVHHVGHVIGMMVRREARGQGIGRLLLEALVAEARRAGLELLTLTVTAGNAMAIALYASNGFTAYGTLARALKIGGRYHDKLHMARELRP